MMSRFGDSYLAAVYILKTNVVGASSSTYEPKRAKNRDTEQVATYYRYTSTDIDLDVDTFKEAVSKGNYQRNECFSNSLFDFYGDNLLRADKNATLSTARPS